MGKESIQFLRGVAIQKDAVIDNPLEIRNPVKTRASFADIGVHFYACSTEDHRQDARNWALESAALEEGSEPYLIRFQLTKDLFPILRNRLYSLLFQRPTRSYRWMHAKFEQIGCEVRLDAKGMAKSDIERLGVTLERVNL